MLRLKSSSNRSIELTCMERGHSHVHMFSDEDIETSLKSLHASKTDRVDPISSDCFKHATDLIIYFMKCIVNLMLSHGHVPTSFLRATVMPIPKNTRLDCNTSTI